MNYWGDTCAGKARGFIGKECPSREQQGKGTEENRSATGLPVSGLIVMELVSWLSMANHSELESFLMVYSSLNQDEFQ